jgi:hypothetical protein
MEKEDTPLSVHRWVFAMTVDFMQDMWTRMIALESYVSSTPLTGDESSQLQAILLQLDAKIGEFEKRRDIVEEEAEETKD